VKKIIGILVALGLVLSMTVMATPVSANVTKADVVITNTDCATDWGTYNITFNVTADLLDGGTTITIVFPADTDLSKLKNITVQQIGVSAATAVPATWITVSGQTLTFYSPLHVVVGASPVVSVVCQTDRSTHGIKNPSVGSTAYTVKVNTSAPVDSTPVESNKYTIRPKLSTYKLEWDSSPTYPGLVEDFVPPFKVCGQNTTGAYEFQPGKFMNAFNLTFATDVIGCNAPCVNATVTGHLTKAVPGSVVTLAMNASGLFNPKVCVPFTVANLTLATNMTVTWNSSIHFDQVGEYEICFNVTCPTSPICGPPGTEVIARECYTFDVKQWKDVYQIDLCRKWNLISLPLVPFETDIDAILASWNGTAAIEGIWYYDRGAPDDCNGEWMQWPAPGTLTDMEDGKAYWVKVAYNHSDPTKQPGAPAGGFYVWGTAEPMPPDSPSAYGVCEGWNMVGFRSMWVRPNAVYLWNFVTPGPSYLYGMIYGWDCTTQSWRAREPGYALAYRLTPTYGYWIPFAVDGTIYP
jgi:hypothetical protein